MACTRLGLAAVQGRAYRYGKRLFEHFVERVMGVASRGRGVLPLWPVVQRAVAG
jgi:hypothetical protein